MTANSVPRYSPVCHPVFDYSTIVGDDDLGAPQSGITANSDPRYSPVCHLTSASNGTNSLTFAYNEDGLRQKKVCNSISTDYYYNGSVLIGMQRGTSKFLFSYDASGNVVSVKYITANSTNEYYYLRNAQNDVVKLIDANGTPVVEYTYDTWGKKVTTTGTLAGTLGLFQPFRYRGYVYDWETGFYYLQSRYYDPTTARFISADVLLSTGQGVLGHNCYAYCNDNPVALKDEGGCIPSYSVLLTDSGECAYDSDIYVLYIVPIYNQGSDPLCWACCQLMIESYISAVRYTPDEVTEWLHNKASEVFGPEYEKKWDKGSSPQNKGRWIPACFISDCLDLYFILEQYGPIYGYYKSEDKDNHYVVITGVNVSKNRVYINNPWGKEEILTFEEFKKTFTQGEDGAGYRLSCVFTVKK